MTHNFYQPTPETIAKLNGAWCASWSGGKDSSSVVTLRQLLKAIGGGK